MSRKELEFGGNIGAFILIIVMPLTTFYLNVACTGKSCSILNVPEFPKGEELFNVNSIFIYLGWFVFQVVLHLIPYGEIHQGLKCETRKCLSYKCNGFFCFVASLIVFAIGLLAGLPIHFVYSNLIPLLVASIVFSFTLSMLLYIKSLNVPKEALAEGIDGTFIYDYFLGRELNPRFGGFDLKFFVELRPGLIGWVILDLCFLFEAYEKYDSPNPSLLLVSVFHIWYVADALWHEEAILTTMDITHDGLGFMLVFGNLSWVPFLYSLQARFLLEHPDVQWSYPVLLMFLALNSAGYLMFRLSNSQKNGFRKNPNDPKFSKLKTLKTSSGKKLLISGWWGTLRHPNYLGDLIMSFAWSMVTGFWHIIPYFYPIYFLSLLLHRGERDDKHCRIKYGQDWDRYCKLVPYKLLPYVY